MAHIECSFYSQALKKNTKCIVFIPTVSADDYLNETGRVYFDAATRFQTLYLLHGSYGNCTDWPLFSNIERYAQDACLAVVMPSVENSAYQDIRGGAAYGTFCSEELPVFLQTIFPLARRRENLFVAGLSMGGYGAMTLSFRNPQRFSRCAVISGCVDFYTLMHGTMNYARKLPPAYKSLLFEGRMGKDVFDLERQLQDTRSRIGELPRYYFNSGSDDPFRTEVMTFAGKLAAAGCSVEKMTAPGAHTWDYWDTHITDVLQWLPLAGRCVVES